VSVHAPGTRWYNAVWRWHFYAGLFCLPFVLWLAATGTIYTWRPQIETWLDRPYDQLPVSGRAADAASIVAAALHAVPGATLHKYQLPQAPGEAVRVIVARHGVEQRVYVDPYRNRVLRVVAEEQRPMRVIFHLHGELLAGAFGSYLVELAACWTITMILTGLYLWWPRGRRGLAGILYPRLRSGKRLFWRDLHAVAGIWASVFALFLITTGLPWAKAWGTYFKDIRVATGTSDGPADWTIGGASPGEQAMLGDHAGHSGMAMAGGTMRHPAPPPGQLDRVVAAAIPLHVAAPVMIAPPAMGAKTWTISSDADDRPLRSEATIDGATGRVVAFRPFSQRHWIDRAVGYGVAAHEGALFGIANQLLSTATALLLMLLSVSGAVMWWRRRPTGLLGAPIPLRRPRFGIVLFASVSLLGVAMPLFGASLIALLLIERFVLRRLSAPARWLGLRAERTA
jgi:uncharacterized iron-regulated membrane protein